MEGKVGAAFSTSAYETGGKEMTIISIICALLVFGMIIVGDPMKATGHFGVGSVGLPNLEEEEYAFKLGARVAKNTLILLLIFFFFERTGY